VVGLAALVVSIGIVDSVNPSTIAPALYLATGKKGERSLALFVAGVFAVNMLAGLVVVLGPGRLVLSFVPHPDSHAKHLLELALGLFCLVIAAALWIGRRHVERSFAVVDARVQQSSLVLGAAIQVVELPTAFPYFAAIAAIVASDANIPEQIVLLALFNAAFVVPLLAILAIRRLAGKRADPLLESWRTWLQRWTPVLIPALFLVIGLGLIAVGAVGLASE
jgi:cytochrome c biogenesis protein CcdA